MHIYSYAHIYTYANIDVCTHRVCMYLHNAYGLPSYVKRMHLNVVHIYSMEVAQYIY